MQVPVGWCVDRYNLRWIYSILFALWSLPAASPDLREAWAS